MIKWIKKILEIQNPSFPSGSPSKEFLEQTAVLRENFYNGVQDAMKGERFSYESESDSRTSR